MATVTHPNVMGLLGACTELVDPNTNNEVWAIVTQYMEKGDLQSVLRPGDNLPLLRKLKFALDIASGMSWLHGVDVFASWVTVDPLQVEIIHNDLKPQNCLVDANWTVKVADFGLSRLRAKGMTVVDRMEGVGTPYYMSPEVCEPFLKVSKTCRHFSKGLWTSQQMFIVLP